MKRLFFLSFLLLTSCHDENDIEVSMPQSHYISKAPDTVQAPAEEPQIEIRRPKYIHPPTPTENFQDRTPETEQPEQQEQEEPEIDFKTDTENCISI